MNFDIVVDNEKCIVCGDCVSICNNHHIFIVNGQIGISGDRCILCGHCEAVCKQNAITVDSNCLVDEDYVFSLNISSEDMSNYMRSRRSIRQYKENEIPTNILEDIMDTVRFAPSAINLQDTKWTIINSKEKSDALEQLMIDFLKENLKNQTPLSQELPLEPIIQTYENGQHPLLRGAPTIIIAKTQDGPYTDTNATIALSYLELLLPSYKLGSCWAGFLKMCSEYPPIKKYLKIENDEHMAGALMVGYPNEEYCNVPKRNQINIDYIE